MPKRSRTVRGRRRTTKYPDDIMSSIGKNTSSSSSEMMVCQNGRCNRRRWINGREVPLDNYRTGYGASDNGNCDSCVRDRPYDLHSRIYDMMLPIATPRVFRMHIPTPSVRLVKLDKGRMRRASRGRSTSRGRSARKYSGLEDVNSVSRYRKRRTVRRKGPRRKYTRRRARKMRRRMREYRNEY